MACHPGDWDAIRAGDALGTTILKNSINDDGDDGEPTTYFDFYGVTKWLEFTGSLDHDQIWEFHRDTEQLTGNELLKKWDSNFSVFDEFTVVNESTVADK
ncbi:hypothetical protein PG988_010349 [Apiospora saccharicola]